MNMPIKSFTNKKIAYLNDIIQKIELDIRTLTNKTDKDLWIEDLDTLEDSYKKF